MSAALDKKTYDAVKHAVIEGLPVHRCSNTGAIIPDHLRGVLFSVRDLHASKFAEIDATFMRKRAA